MVWLNLVKENRKIPFYFWSRYFCARKSNLTYYEILKLQRNCTTEDIRNAFLKLSKEYHPDVKGSQNESTATAQFIKVREAYQVLSKKSTRRIYDRDLFARGYNMYDNFRSPKNESSWKVHPNYYGEFPKSNPGIKKVSNSTILWFLFVFTVLGSGFEFFLVRSSFTFNRERLDEISKENNSIHESIRADANKYSNEKQIERIAKRLLKTS